MRAYVYGHTFYYVVHIEVRGQSAGIGSLLHLWDLGDQIQVLRSSALAAHAITW